MAIQAFNMTDGQINNKIMLKIKQVDFLYFMMLVSKVKNSGWGHAFKD